MGLKISEEFPSRFLSGDEINGAQVPVTISEVKEEYVAKKVGSAEQERILVVYFEGKERGVRLGAQRAKELRSITGSDDTDGWKGKKVIMYTKQQKAFGELHNVIHFKQDDGSVPQGQDDVPTINYDQPQNPEDVDVNDIPL